jgi:hypothetical protein
MTDMTELERWKLAKQLTYAAIVLGAIVGPKGTYGAATCGRASLVAAAVTTAGGGSSG